MPIRQVEIDTLIIRNYNVDSSITHTTTQTCHRTCQAEKRAVLPTYNWLSRDKETPTSDFHFVGPTFCWTACFPYNVKIYLNFFCATTGDILFCPSQRYLCLVLSITRLASTSFTSPSSSSRTVLSSGLYLHLRHKMSSEHSSMCSLRRNFRYVSCFE